MPVASVMYAAVIIRISSFQHNNLDQNSDQICKNKNTQKHIRLRQIGRKKAI